MKRLTPLLTLLTGTGMAAVLFTMSAQAAPPAAQPKPAGQPAATAPASPQAPPAPPAAPDPSVRRPTATPQPAAPATPGAGDAPTTGAPAPKVDANWTGRLNSGATIAVTATDGKAVAYVCDGKRLEIWLRGTAANGKLALTGKDGAKLTGTFGNGKASGELVVGNRRWTFTATATAKAAPVLYRATAQVRDARVDGGWIMLSDGSQIGVVTWNGSPVPAPPLDPAFNTTIVNGVSLKAAPVVPNPGPGQ